MAILPADSSANRPQPTPTTPSKPAEPAPAKAEAAAKPTDAAGANRVVDMFDYSRLRPSKLDLDIQRARDLGIGIKPVKQPQTKEEALKAIDSILIGPKVNQDPDGPGDGQGTVNTDPDDVDDKADTSDLSVRHQKAEQQVKANEELEKKELEKLTPTQREQYYAVKAQLEKANDPVAQLALQKLLFEGKLPGAKDMVHGGTLLQNLATLASPTTELADGIDRGQLLSDLVQECAVPSAIAQHGKGTCAATSVVIDLARENPAEYVRLMTGLASPDGEAELANGDVIKREDGTIGDDGSGRSITQRLVEPAFMEYADGDLDYRNGEDAHYDKDGNKVHTGLYPNQVNHLLEGVFDRKHTEMDAGDDKSREAIWAEIERQVGAGRDVEAGMKWGNGGHEVLITGISTGPDGKQYVTYINPWGKEETLPKDEFLKRVWSINYDSAPTLPKIDWSKLLAGMRLQKIAA